MLTFYGLLAGGFGFPLGDFWNALGRSKWGPIGQYPILQEFGYWTVMEQTFGYAMGLGVALGIVRLIRGQLKPAEEDSQGRWLNPFCVFVLIGVLFAFNFLTNYEHWMDAKAWASRPMVVPETLGLSSGWMLSWVVVMILGLLAVALYLQQTGKLQIAPESIVGRSKLLALIVIWMVMAIYIMLPRIGLPTSLMFFAAIGVGTLLILVSSPDSMMPELSTSQSPDSAVWALGWKHWLLWALLPIVICGLASITMKLEIPTKQIRFVSATAVE